MWIALSTATNAAATRHAARRARSEKAVRICSQPVTLAAVRTTAFRSVSPRRRPTGGQHKAAGNRCVARLISESPPSTSARRALDPGRPERRGRGHAAASLIIIAGRSCRQEFPSTRTKTYIWLWDADNGIFPDVTSTPTTRGEVSRRHARIMRLASSITSNILGSTRYFHHRGRRLLPGDRQPLNDGYEIIIGKTFLRFHVRIKTAFVP